MAAIKKTAPTPPAPPVRLRLSARTRDPHILAAIQRVPRREFLDPEMTLRANDDNALPIGFGQTTSQPSVIAQMLEMLSPPTHPARPASDHSAARATGGRSGGRLGGRLGGSGSGRGKKFGRILEVGAGCGYQTALLAELSEKVCAVERIPELAKLARARMRKMRYNNAVVTHADGLTGWAEFAPYDGVIICAEGPRAPTALLSQLKPDGRLVMPLLEGPVARLVAMNPVGDIIERGARVAFVPLLEGAA